MRCCKHHMHANGKLWMWTQPKTQSGMKFAVWMVLFSMWLTLEIVKGAVSQYSSPLYSGSHKMAAMLLIHRAWVLFSWEHKSQPESTWLICMRSCQHSPTVHCHSWPDKLSLVLVAMVWSSRRVFVFKCWQWIICKMDIFLWVTSGVWTFRQEKDNRNYFSKFKTMMDRRWSFRVDAR